MKDFWICVISLKRNCEYIITCITNINDYHLLLFEFHNHISWTFAWVPLPFSTEHHVAFAVKVGILKEGKQGENKNISGMFIFLGVQKHLLSILPAVHVHSQVHVKSLKKSLAIAWLRHSLNVKQTVRQSEKRTNLLAKGVDFSFGHPTVELWVRSMLSNSSSDRIFQVIERCERIYKQANESKWHHY